MALFSTSTWSHIIVQVICYARRLTIHRKDCKFFFFLRISNCWLLVVTPTQVRFFVCAHPPTELGGKLSLQTITPNISSRIKRFPASQLPPTSRSSDHTRRPVSRTGPERRRLCDALGFHGALPAKNNITFHLQRLILTYTVYRAPMADQIQ